MNTIPVPSARRSFTTGVLAISFLVAGLSSAAEVKLDGLLAVIDAPSPCVTVQVQIFESEILKTMVALTPTGEVKPLGKTTPIPRFVKGMNYRLQAVCVSTKGIFQNTGLSFKADGRTVMVVFTKAGFVIKRGGLAY
ncbi:hypothetical protein [Deinococcus sp. QL22]|uniref:hypothetical protein n=1 Tax=Deinococcus sp. QL22 TaxID=2939437 RepID=UPI002017CB0B|nr:hypothetical protein [Deinococcus sp. QL22]UQN08397.1 hypothetical protein M1R55_16865 [Deinococcus sp. QL22]